MNQNDTIFKLMHDIRDLRADLNAAKAHMHVEFDAIRREMVELEERQDRKMETFLSKFLNLVLGEAEGLGEVHDKGDQNSVEEDQ